MTNQKSQTIREIGPACTNAILSPARKCPANAENGSAAISGPRITPRPEVLESGNHVSLASSSHLSSAPQPPTDLPPASVPTNTRKVSRNGKIARLAKPLRDMVNLMLQNNISHPQIAGALDEHGIRVTARNISNWKTRGGYEEWRLEHERALEKRLRQDNLTDYLRTTDATQLPEVGLQLAATQISEFFLKSETEQQLATNPEKFARTISNLCRITRHLHLLQKYRDDSARQLGPEQNPELIKRETEQILEGTRNTYCSFIPENAPIEPEIPHRNFIPKGNCLNPASL